MTMNKSSHFPHLWYFWILFSLQQQLKKRLYTSKLTQMEAAYSSYIWLLKDMKHYHYTRMLLTQNSQMQSSWLSHFLNQ